MRNTHIHIYIYIHTPRAYSHRCVAPEAKLRQWHVRTEQQYQDAAAAGLAGDGDSHCRSHQSWSELYDSSATSTRSVHGHGPASLTEKLYGDLEMLGGASHFARRESGQSFRASSAGSVSAENLALYSTRPAARVSGSGSPVWDDTRSNVPSTFLGAGPQFAPHAPKRMSLSASPEAAMAPREGLLAVPERSIKPAPPGRRNNFKVVFYA